jgi:hypothetical protein
MFMCKYVCMYLYISDSRENNENIPFLILFQKLFCVNLKYHFGVLMRDQHSFPHHSTEFINNDDDALKFRYYSFIKTSEASY